MESTHEGELDFPMLRPNACHAHIVPALQNCSLLSIGQLCDSGYKVIFDSPTMQVMDGNICVLTGQRNNTNGMWEVELPTRDEHANAITTQTAAELIAFAHATLFSPALSTLENALTKGYLINFPGLTAKLLRKHPPTSIAMVKGHLDQTRKNQQSTKKTAPKAPHLIEPDIPTKALDTDDMSPAAITQRSDTCFCSVMEPTGQIYTDQTGRFVVPSSNGNNYLMVCYDYDSNTIFTQPFKNRTATCLLEAYKILHERLCRAGLRPKLQRLDNECSQLLTDFMHQENIDFQLVPPSVHRRNAAERAIRTFQNHFIAGLCSVDKDFPLHLWDRLLPQAEISLNLLRGSRINPKLSAWAQVNGTFDFNRTPLGPPGCRVLAHEKPANRTTWSPHGLDGWYTGPALSSYRCYTIWIWETRADRICDTITWFPTKVTIPPSSSTDIIMNSLHDIVQALKNPAPASPIAPRTDTQTKALLDLTELLTSICQPAPLQPTEKPLLPPIPLATTPVPSQRVRFSPETLPEAPTLVPPDDNAIPATVPPTEESPPPQRVPIPCAPDTEHLIPSTKPSKTPPSTYAHLTGPTGRRNRKHHRRRATHSTPKRRSPRTPARRRSTRQSAKDAIAAHAEAAMHCAMHGTAMNPDTGRTAEYKELSRCSDGEHWKTSNAEEIGRMFQGLGPDSDMPTGTGTLSFINKSQIPKTKKSTYVRVVCADRPEKANTKRVRWTAGGDRIDYPGNKTTKTADITTAKLLFNSVISTPNGRFMTIDLKDFYLCSDLPDYEYVRIPLHMLPQAIIDLYKLEDKIVDGHVYAEVRKGMYGLPQAGKLANDQLCQFLEPHGYLPCPVTPGLFKDTNSDLMFTLVVDDFGVRYTNNADVDKLIAVLQQHYKLTTDWTGARYIGLTLAWDYDNQIVDISMPGYIERALHRFNHRFRQKHQHSPHKWASPEYGSRQQYEQHDNTPALDLKDTKFVQEVLGTLLYYGRAVDCTMITAIGSIATHQASATQATLESITQLLDYCATYPDAIIRFRASDMILYVESDASYLCESKARSRAAGYHYLSTKRANPDNPPSADDPQPPLNGPINVVSKVLREVLSSAAEAELAGLFLNGKEAVPERITLEELGHLQPPTPIVTDNSTASGIANDSMKQRRSKAMDMRFYWIRDRVRQGQFHVYWRKGSTNRADYFTKHHPAKYHREMRATYIHDPSKNYYAALEEGSQPQHTKPSPPSGEGVLIPSLRRPSVIRRMPIRPSGRLSSTALRRH
jgi:hypothetical protein